MTHAIALLTIVGQVLIALYLLGLPWRKSWLRPLYDLAGEYALLGAILVVFGGMAGSLYFSEVAKFPPCELCWYQRVLLYPQLVLLGLALLKKNRDIELQVLTLSVFGLVISVYQSYLQYGGTALIPCSTSALAVSCGQKNFLEFGYITIPVMAMTGFVLLIVAMVLHRQRPTSSSMTADTQA